MLETIRGYAQERLEMAGDAEDVGRRHLDWCLELVQPVAVVAPVALVAPGSRSTPWLPSMTTCAPRCARPLMVGRPARALASLGVVDAVVCARFLCRGVGLVDRAAGDARR